MSDSRSTFQHIAASWLSLKPWVKCWLFFLNAVFLAAFAFAADPAARWILLAYAASGPLLAWLMVRQRGLTRLLGVAHLVPWAPLLVYIALRLSSELVGPAVTLAVEPFLAGYLYILLACLTVCLALDAWDVVRYLRGERYVLGSPEAVRRGASRPGPTRLPCEGAH
ncbi:MAG: hypothetical protein SGJ01_10355 [Gemmatimonadota bacterium]|nr:hypothetical protein [Gemmatimonadota bacterium]MDZ4863834.1 hypothetical protein [Gemmatimonadota bacterium]